MARRLVKRYNRVLKRHTVVRGGRSSWTGDMIHRLFLLGKAKRVRRLKATPGVGRRRRRR